MYNRIVTTPEGFERVGTFDDPVWVGNPSLPAERQGLSILGTPLGHAAFVEARLREISDEHRQLLDRLQSVPDLQSAWLILSQCASTRANFHLRSLQPSLTEEFAAEHDRSIWQSLKALLDREDSCGSDDERAKRIAQLPMRLGGLGLRSATRRREAAYLASWVDVLHMIQQRSPTVAAQCVAELSGGATARAQCIREAATC